MRLTDITGNQKPVLLGDVKLCGGKDGISLRPLSRSKIKRTSRLVKVKYLGVGQFGGVTDTGSKYLFSADPSTVAYAAERYGLVATNLDKLLAQVAETTDYAPQQGKDVGC